MMFSLIILNAFGSSSQTSFTINRKRKHPAGIMSPLSLKKKIAGKPARTANKPVNSNIINGTPATNAGRLRPL